MSLQNSPPSLQDSAEKAKRRGYFLINTAYFAFWAVIAFLVIRYLFSWMIPFILGFVLAVLLQRPIKWLVKKTHISRKFFSVFLVVLIILIIAGLVAVLGWQLVSWVAQFLNADTIASMTTYVTELLDNISTALGGLALSLPDGMADALKDGIASLSGMLLDLFSGLLTSLAGGAVSVTTALPNVLVNFFMWILSSIFLTIDYDLVIGFLKRQIPTRFKPMLRAAKDFTGNAVFGFIRAYGLLIVLTFVELSVGFLILRVPYAIPLALLVAFIDVLPVLGTGTVLIPWSLIALILGDYRMFIGIGLLYVIITVIRNIIEPKLVSVQIGLHPVVTLFFMLLGLRAMGVLGMFIFPLAVIIIKQLHDAGYIRLWK